MASDNEASCESDPNFAVICAFMEKFGTTCGLQSIDFLELQEMLENTQEVPQELIDLHIKLLRKSRKTVSNEKWEKAVIKFCHTFCVQDAWELERFGYKKARLSSKLRVLKELLEMQFDYNARFKAEINKMSAEELRSQPLGKDKQGHAYWFQNDNNCQIRVYKEDPDEETWTLVARDRDGLASLIGELSDGDSKISSESAINEEDSNSLAEKPITDTGQVDSSSDSNKKMSGDSESSNESKESAKKEENISPQETDEEETATAKRCRESDEETCSVKKTKLEISDAIEEPLMLVKGMGEGEENECVNPIVGEEIEEDLVFFYGEGDGVECQTGNEDKASESQTNQESDSSARDASDSGVVSISDSKNCVNDEVPTSPVKNPYKLGTIIDTKTDNKFFSTVKSPIKKSRWDVETIIAKDAPDTGRVKELVTKWEQANEEKDDDAPKKAMFFFGPGCLQFAPATMAFGQKVPPEKNESLEVLPDNEKGDVGYRIGENEATSDCVQSGPEAGPLVNQVDHETPIESRIDKVENDVNPTSDNVDAAKAEQTKVEDSPSVDEEEEVESEERLVQAALEQQVEKEETQSQENQRIPEVTAALVEFEEEPHVQKEEGIIEQTDNSVPVVEETCVKKHSYLLGDETNKEDVVQNHQEEENETSDNVKVTTDIRKEASEEESNTDENENTQVVVKDSINSELDEEVKISEDIRIEETAVKISDDIRIEEAAVSEHVKTGETSTASKEEIIISESVSKTEDAKEEKVKDTPNLESVVKSEEKVTNKEEVTPENEEILKDTTVAEDKPQPQGKPEMPRREAVVYLKNEDKLRIEEKIASKEEANNTSTKRGRKNNTSSEEEKKPRVFTRRTTRSTKNDEQSEDVPVEVLPPTRRGRQRANQKVNKEENSEGDSSKKMKLSAEETKKKEEAKETQSKKEETDKTEAEEAQSKKKKESDKSEAEETQLKKKTVEETEDASPASVLSTDSGKKMKLPTEETTKKEETEETQSKKEKETDKSETEEPKKSEETEDKPEETAQASPASVLSTNATDTVMVESSSSSCDVVELPDNDPLEASEEEAKPAKDKPMSLSTFSLDFVESPTPTPPLTRSGLRKRGRDNSEEKEETSGKRPKVKAKRAVDVKLRKSIEEQKKKELISSDDDSKNEHKSAKKKHGKKVDELKNEESILVSSDADKEEAAEPSKKKSRKNKNQRLLQNLGIDPDALDFGQSQIVGVRQSRRIAQLKIKEEAERRKLEDDIVHDSHKKKKSKKSEDKDYKVEKKKPKNDVEDDEAAEDDSADSKKRKKKKKKHRKFDELNPWRSSSDSSSSNDEDDMGEEEEEEDEVLQFVSDHEFSPESDMEGDGESLPLKRARTARKESDVEEVDDCPCQKCGKSDHPEWILLCDSCDNGWHCSCLRPPLLVIPEGDWFCPPCQHASLLKQLQEKLKEYDKVLNKKVIEDRRKQRLAYVGISLNSVLPAKETENIKKRRIRTKRLDDDDDDDLGDESSSDDSESGSVSESGSDSDEPIYQLRQRRQAHSYRFNDYDELINSAIQDEMDAVKGAGNQGRGKDIATIVNAEKEEEWKKETEAAPEEPVELEPLPPVVPLTEKDKEPKPLFEDDDDVVRTKKKIIGRKKHRKLNSLDISSADDDGDSDEDFKGTSSESDDDFDEDLGSDDSDDLGRRRKGNDPVRRSTRARTSRYDADFIDDGDSDSEDDSPRKKKKRSYWDESESEESDRSWGRRRRKPVSRSKKSSSTSKKKSKKKKKHQDSDEEVYKKKKPKIKFGLDGDDDGPVRRTRGKKINYVDALGSDSDEERVKRPPPRIDSDEEYVANEDDEKISEEEADSNGEKVQIQSYTDARFTQLLPEPKNQEDGENELNPIDQINRNVEMMDENEMEKMMEEEEYANRQLQMVAQQLEKEKRRKEREAKKLEGVAQPPLQDLKKRGRKPKDQFQFSGAMQEPLVSNADNLIINSENNDELSEPPGVSLPLFAELGTADMEDLSKKRRGKSKKSLEEAVANLGSARQHDWGNKTLPTDLSVQESNIEIAAPPQPFSQSQPTPSVITRMLQSKPGQPGYPVGTIRPKQFATMPDREEDVHHSMSSSPAHHGQYIQGAGVRPQLSSPYRQMAPNLNHYPRTAPPPPIRNPVPHLYHSHRPMDPSPSGGGTISIADHNSPGRVVSPASSSPGSKNETPPPPYSRAPPPAGGRFPMISAAGAGPRHLQMVPPPHLQPPRPNMSPYHPGLPPQYHYGQFGQEDAMPPTMYQNSPYSEQFEGQVNPSENSNNSKSFDEESGGEFGGLVSYFSSQREDDLES